MKVNQISVLVGYTKNLGNYESLRLDAGVTVEVEEGENEKKAYKKAWDLAGEQISEQLALFGEEKKSGVHKGLK